MFWAREMSYNTTPCLSQLLHSLYWSAHNPPAAEFFLHETHLHTLAPGGCRTWFDSIAEGGWVDSKVGHALVSPWRETFWFSGWHANFLGIQREDWELGHGEQVCG